MRNTSNSIFLPLLFLQLFFALPPLNYVSAFPLVEDSHGIYDTQNVPIQLELVDTGPIVVPCDESDDHSEFSASYFGSKCSSDLYHLRMSGLEEISAPGLFPFTSSEITIQLFRDPVLNKQLHNLTDYNIFAIDQNGVDQRVDGIELDDYKRPHLHNSKISFFRGKVLIPEEGSSSSSSSRSESNIMAIGYIDDQHDTISLQAFIQYRNVLLYLRPNSGHNSTNFGIWSNSHFISNESNNAMGPNFFELFQKQFAQRDLFKRRAKRQSDEVKNSCPMMIMADYSLFTLMNRSRAKTVLFVHFVYTVANEIFLSTTFTRNGFVSKVVDDIANIDYFHGYGHTLCKIVIEEFPPRIGDELYNENRTTWPQNHLERVLKRLRDRASYCLAFVFTNLKIEGTMYSDVNGISMDGGIFSEDQKVANGGAVSFYHCRDPWNLDCVLNFAHELGHSWGAIHDSDTEECFPQINGSYLMSFPFLYSIGQNNFFFSPCSIRAIYVKIEHLLSEDPRIFSSYCTKCGNGRVEDNEQCDEGDGSYGTCCSKSCTFLGNATCSPYNHDCCDDHCAVAARNEICRTANSQYCFSESRCNGNSSKCPDPTILPDGSKCGPSNSGSCVSGFCSSTCPPKHSYCDCDHACQTCCQAIIPIISGNEERTELGVCKPMIYKADGSPCLFNETLPGRCMTGWCEAIKPSGNIPKDVVPSNDNEDVVVDGTGGETRERAKFFTLPNVIIIILLLLVLGFCCTWALRVYWNRVHSGHLDFLEGAGPARSYSDAKEREPIIGQEDNDSVDLNVNGKNGMNGHHIIIS